jgi:hypothetical protein
VGKVDDEVAGEADEDREAHRPATAHRRVTLEQLKAARLLTAFHSWFRVSG